MQQDEEAQIDPKPISELVRLNQPLQSSEN
jgi:hypothetical protein